MALSYIYSDYKDIYTLENTGIVALSYTLSKVECDSVTTVKTGSINVGQKVTLPIKYIDGVYKIEISDNIESLILPDILFYNNLLLSIADNVERTLCGCKGCGTCDDCDDGECLLQLNTIVSMLSFTIVNNPKYDHYASVIANNLKCSFDSKILCYLTNQQIHGKEEVKDLVLNIIAMYYLVFFLLDLAQAQDQEEADYIKLKYKSVKILKCIKKLGIIIDNISEEMFSGMQVFYWQLDNVQDDINDVIPLFNSTFLNDKPVLPFETFETGFIVNYSLIGRTVFAIKETDVLNFTISDSLNNDITDEFDNYYFPLTKTVLFVSKNPFSFSNVYFKFKKLIFTP